MKLFVTLVLLTLGVVLTWFHAHRKLTKNDKAVKLNLFKNRFIIKSFAHNMEFSQPLPLSREGQSPVYGAIWGSQIQRTPI